MPLHVPKGARVHACHPAWLFIHVDLLDMASHRTQGRLSWQCTTTCQCEILLWLQLIDGRQWLLKVDILKAASAHRQRSEVLFTSS